MVSQVEAAAEPDTRYEHIANIFRAMKEIDPYNPEMNTAILAKVLRGDGDLAGRGGSSF